MMCFFFFNESNMFQEEIFLRRIRADHSFPIIKFRCNLFVKNDYKNILIFLCINEKEKKKKNYVPTLH